MEAEQGYHKKKEMQRMLGQAAGSCQKCLETHLEAKSVQVQRLQQRTACTQVRHNKVETMGGDFYAVLGQWWELRRRHEEEREGNEVQLVRADETFACLQSCQTKSEKLFNLALQGL